jgi:hypothetical protein
LAASAVKVTVCEAVTALAVATKSALLAPAATVTDAGTDTAPLLLPSDTTSPLSPAGALNSTVQLSVVDPVIELLVQLNAVRLAVRAAAVPVPLSPTATLLTPAVLLTIVSCPDASPVDVGLNCTVKVNVLLGLTLAGSALWLLTANGPLTLICEMRTGEDPSLVTVTLVLALCPTATDPNATVCVDATSDPGSLVFFEVTEAIGAVQPDRIRLEETSTTAASSNRPNLPIPARKGGLSTLQERTKVTIDDYRFSQSIRSKAVTKNRY